VTAALCIDLDGTLIKEDITWEATVLLLKQAPWRLGHLLCWILRGRAYLKARLGQHIFIDSAQLTYHPELITFIRQERQQGRYVALVTAADQSVAHAIATHLGIFDEVLASNGTINLRAEQKARALCQRFGDGQFTYAGNSRDDLKVWPFAANIIIVNASPCVRRRAEQLNKPTLIFKKFKT
jgi:phosphoserine phosphatase